MDAEARVQVSACSGGCPQRLFCWVDPRSPWTHGLYCGFQTRMHHPAWTPQSPLWHVRRVYAVFNLANGPDRRQSR